MSQLTLSAENLQAEIHNSDSQRGKGNGFVSRSNVVRLSLFLAFAPVLFYTSCPKKPTSDSTPPIVKWNVRNSATGETQDIIGGGTIRARNGDTFIVKLTVEDPEGVHKIGLGGNTSWDCVSHGTENVAQHVGPSLEPVQEQTFNPDSKGKVLTSIFLFRNINSGPFDCQRGFLFDGGMVVLVGTGENYSRGITEATLGFDVPK